VNEGDLTALLVQHASRHSVPGAAIGILREGAVTTAYYGVANVSSGEPVTPETLFSVGSLTKSMVATVIARLAEAGRLSLDDPVTAHVPELRGSGWAQSATLRDLLANRSGLPLRAGLEFDFDGRKEQDDGALSRFAADVAAVEPAAKFWSYTNAGWCLLGRVIETATDGAWEDAMRRHLASAGMRETTFATDATTKRRASGHEVTADGPVPVEPLVGRAYGPAGTTAVSTVTDLLRFARTHLEDSSLAALRTVHAEVSIYGWLDSWCLGWARFDWEGGRVWGWDGLVNGERSVLRIMPEHRAAVVLMTNGSTGRAMYRSLFADLMESLFGISVSPLRLDASPGAAGDLSRFAGVYAWPDERVEVTAAGSCLLIKSEDGETEAPPLDERTFLVDALDPDNPTVTFGSYDASGRPHVIYLMLWGLPRLDE
jgi:CubicO group peptidase (beta-lactamase class C family)